MTTATRTVTKALAAEEDLLYGEGTASQTRGDNSYTVTKIRGFRPVNDIDELNALDFNKFPKAVMVQNGAFAFYQFNGAEYEQIVPLTKTQTVLSSNPVISVIGVETLLLQSASLTITTLNNGTKGQKLHIISEVDNQGIENNAGIVLKGGTNYTFPKNTGITLINTGTVWAEV